MTTFGRIEILDRLPDDVYGGIESKIRWKRYESGAEILHHKDAGRDVYFVGSGHVRATTFSALGKEVTYRDLFQGEIFGELSALDGLPRSASVVAVEPSDIGVMSGEEFVSIIHQHSEVADAFMLRLVSVIRRLTDRIYWYDSLTVRDRVRKELLLLAGEHMNGPNTAVIPQMPKHAELANRIDTHREAVARELSILARMGLVHREGRKLTVTNVAGLAHLLPDI